MSRKVRELYFLRNDVVILVLKGDTVFYAEQQFKC